MAASSSAHRSVVPKMKCCPSLPNGRPRWSARSGRDGDPTAAPCLVPFPRLSPTFPARLARLAAPSRGLVESKATGIGDPHRTLSISRAPANQKDPARIISSCRQHSCCNGSTSTLTRRVCMIRKSTSRPTLVWTGAELTCGVGGAPSLGVRSRRHTPCAQSARGPESVP